MSIFSKVPIRRPRSSKFHFPHSLRMSTDFGRLTPIFCEPVIPGDVFKMKTTSVVRLAPLLAPVFADCNLFMHYFFVPNRLIWDGWEEFITGGEDGKSSIVYPHFHFQNVNLEATSSEDIGYYLQKSRLADYLGFPVHDNNYGEKYTDVNDFVFDALPFRAYQLIYNEYFRDQNLEDEVNIQKDVSGIIEVSSSKEFVKQLLTLRNRAWGKDYFTSALPWPQRGGDVLLPLQGEAAVTSASDLSVDLFKDGAPGSVIPSQTVLETTTGNPRSGNADIGSTDGYLESDGVHVAIDPNGAYRVSKNSIESNLKTDLSTASATTMNELRRAEKLQQWLENNARVGSRYIEQIFGHFGVKSSDARLQRPEFLGGGKQPVVFRDVLQTSSSTDDSPQANYAGVGITAGSPAKFKRFFEEHGYVIGIMSIIPKASYQQGMPRKYTKFDKFDYYFPEFAHLGEQEIKNSELMFKFFDSETNYNDGVFGYTPRYAEYKYMPSRVAGDFRDNLSFWHMGRIFEGGSTPGLNPDFVKMKEEEVSRIFAVTDSKVDSLYCDVFFDLRANRPMPKFGVPMF